MKPQSCQDPRTTVASFKGELCHCHRLCSTPEKTKEAINFVLEMYEDNGHDRQMLQQVADTYTPPPLQQRKENNKNNNKNRSPSNDAESETRNLFDQLPFQCTDLCDSDETKSYVCVPYIPEIGPLLRRILKKSNITTTFTSAPKLKDILCSKNKTQPHPHQKKGCTCTCSNTFTYFVRPTGTLT